MSARTVALLAAALVVLLVIVVAGQRSNTAPTGSGAALVPGLTAALGDIERVTIVKANNETVATLEKRPASWVVADKHGYAADAAKLRQALTALGEAASSSRRPRTRTSTAASASRTSRRPMRPASALR